MSFVSYMILTIDNTKTPFYIYITLQKWLSKTGHFLFWLLDIYFLICLTLFDMLWICTCTQFSFHQVTFIRKKRLATAFFTTYKGYIYIILNFFPCNLNLTSFLDYWARLGWCWFGFIDLLWLDIQSCRLNPI